jgi:hypothetical protein
VVRDKAPFNSMTAPALTAPEVNDVIVFLDTLTDKSVSSATAAPASTFQAVVQ